MCRQLTIAAVAAACIAAPTAAGPIEFLDQTFDPADYTIIYTTGTNGQTALQEPDGGASGTKPDPFRRVTTVTHDDTYTAHINNNFLIDPAATAVDAIECSIDARAIVAYSQGMAYGFAVMQGDVVVRFRGTITGSGSAAFQWVTHSITVQPEQFADIDFSPAGEPIRLGFFTGNSGGMTISVGYDNLRFSIVTSSCPEDLNGDGLVGFGDLNIVLDDFNTSGEGLPGDVDQDGDVDFEDLNRVVSLFNTEC